MEVMEGKTETPREQLPRSPPSTRSSSPSPGRSSPSGWRSSLPPLVWLVGRPVSEGEATTTVGYVLPDSPAAAAGLKAGDEISQRRWQPGPPLQRHGIGQHHLAHHPQRGRYHPGHLRAHRRRRHQTLRPSTPGPRSSRPNRGCARPCARSASCPPSTPWSPRSSPAAPRTKPGLKPNDSSSSIDGQPAYTLDAIADYVKDHPQPSYTLDVEREGTTIQLPFTPVRRACRGCDVRQPRRKRRPQGRRHRSPPSMANAMPDGVAISDYIHAHGDKPSRLHRPG